MSAPSAIRCVLYCIVCHIARDSTIVLQEMYSAKITRCRHFFHGVCLRKWLYVQDRCPLCHEIMMYTDKADENAPEAEPAPAAQAEQPMRIYPRDVSNKWGYSVVSLNVHLCP